MRTVIHEIRNHLAVAIAQLDAMMDGKMATTPARLSTVREALSEIDVLINDLSDEGPAKPD